MSRPRAALMTLVFLVIAPGTIAGAIPYLIAGWRRPEALPLSLLGAPLILAGIVLTLECFARFVIRGRGTPAPLAPTDHLVVTGAYRWVRNPMYVGVLGIILGQAALFASPWLLAYGAGIWLILNIFVRAYEEPNLRRQFSADYAAYFAAVPRWRPRLNPWRPTLITST